MNYYSREKILLAGKNYYSGESIYYSRERYITRGRQILAVYGTRGLPYIYLIYETTSEVDSNEAHCVPGTSYLFFFIHTVTRTTVMIVRITANVPATVRYRWEIIMQVNRQVYHSMHLIILVIKCQSTRANRISLSISPLHILRLINCSLVNSNLSQGIAIWDINVHAWNNAHTDTPFKALDQLKINEALGLSIIRFCYRYLQKKTCPLYFIHLILPPKGSSTRIQREREIKYT